MNPRVVSGIQPTGPLHVGNYLGSLRQFVELQNRGAYDCFFFVADLHSITEDFDPKRKREEVRDLVATLVSLGLDPDQSTIFLQSDIPAHASLAWILSTLTPMSELERMTQYKDKTSRQPENVNVGLFTYPVLQAADILLYRAAKVPVGQDQVQHIELTRTLARKFNARFGETFPEPEALLTETPKVMSLMDPTKKMSKSLGDAHVLNIFDDSTRIERKVKRSVTATETSLKAPAFQNLFTLLKAFGGPDTVRTIEAKANAGTLLFAELKAAVAAGVIAFFAKARKRYLALRDDDVEISRILDIGKRRAHTVATETLAEVFERVGLQAKSQKPKTKRKPLT